LEKLLALALPKKWPGTLLSLGTPSQQNASAPPGDLGVSFLNVARESGLNAKTIFGGEHKKQISSRNHRLRRRFLRLRQ